MQAINPFSIDTQFSVSDCGQDPTFLSGVAVVYFCNNEGACAYTHFSYQGGPPYGQMYTASLDLSSLPPIADPSLLCGDSTVAQIVQGVQSFTDPTTLCPKLGPLSSIVCNFKNSGGGSAAINSIVCSAQNSFTWYLYSPFALQGDGYDYDDDIDEAGLGTYSSYTYIASYFPGWNGALRMPTIDGTLLPPCCIHNCYTTVCPTSRCHDDSGLRACLQNCASAAMFFDHDENP